MVVVFFYFVLCVCLVFVYFFWLSVFVFVGLVWFGLLYVAKFRKILAKKQRGKTHLMRKHNPISNYVKIIEMQPI